MLDFKRNTVGDAEQLNLVFLPLPDSDFALSHTPCYVHSSTLICSAIGGKEVGGRILMLEDILQHDFK